jgi:ABC-type molybdate transport system ATPase subunit
MQLSARNQLKGKIVEIKKGATTAHVSIDVGGQMLHASLSRPTSCALRCGCALRQKARCWTKYSAPHHRPYRPRL